MNKAKCAIFFLLILGTINVCVGQELRIRAFTTTIGNGTAANSCDIMVYTTIDEFVIYQYGINLSGTLPDLNTPPIMTYKYKRIGDLETGADAIGTYMQASYRIKGKGEFFRTIRFHDSNNLLIDLDTQKDKNTYYLTESGIKKFKQ